MFNGWRAWFVDDTGLVRYSSKDTKFKDLPKDGCIAIQTLYPDEGAANYNGYDFYFMSEDHNGERFIGCDIAQRERNIESEIHRRYRDPIVILGQWTSDSIMRTVLDEMNNV